MKIVYIIDSLATKGGVERIVSEKMNYLATHWGYNISVITCFQFPESMSNCYFLSDKVRQINLSIPSHLQYYYHYPKRLWIKWYYYHQLRRKILEAVNSINPDIIIGLGYTTSDLACSIKCKAKKIFESHEARLFSMSGALNKKTSPLSRACYKLYRKHYLHIIEKRADVVVTLTKGDAYEWRKAKRVEIIPNFSNMSISKLSDCESKRVIAIGRLEWQKRYDCLIDIWTLVSNNHPDWILDIYGEGAMETELKNAIKEKRLSNISIHPYTKNISMEYANSSICVLTSRFEGFSLVLLEAMRHGVPCVTFDCPYGPKDLIDHDKCGYVVENGNINVFADKLNYLMDHPEVRKSFSIAAVNKVKSYHVDTIMKQWKSLFESLTKKY